VEGEDGGPEGGGEQPTEQAWRRDRILVKIARTHALLGNEAEAERFETGVVESESGQVAAVRAARLPEEDFDRELAALDAFIAGTNLDQARTAMDVCAQLHDRFYADAARRARVEERIRAAEPKMPVAMNIELLMELAGHALDHGDSAGALALVERAKGFAGACTHVPMVARLAALRHSCGDREKARAEADAARAMCEQQRPEIVDIYRAGMLRPLAEAYLAMGEPAVALEVYRQAVEEGVGNPNSRPRAEDLAATCLSMARHGLQPDDELQARIYQVFGALGAPW
jgi:tetratricopeptide (TPR) repeat protein